MRSRRLLAVAAAVAMLSWATPAAGQAPRQDPIERFLGRPVVAVEVRVEGRPDTSPALLALVDIRPGDPLSPEAWRRVSQRFDEVPRFEAVRILLEERADGVVLVFDLTPRHPINALAFTGETGVPPAELDREIREQFNGLPAVTRLADVEDAVRRILRNEGYRSANALATIVKEHDPDRATLTVQVAAGPRAMIAETKIEGRSSLDPEKTIRNLGVAPGDPFRERVLVANLAEIREQLRGKRFYRALADYQPPRLSDDGTKVWLVVRIDAGPVVELTVNGELPGSINDFIPIKRESSVDTDLLEGARQSIVREFQRQGYWRATASFTAVPGLERLTVTFTTSRGKRYRVVGVEVPAGLRFSSTDLQTQKALKTGEWFDERAVVSALVQFQGRYQEQGYHRAVMKPEYVDVAGRAPDEGGVIIRPNITEGPKATVSRITFSLSERPSVTEAELRTPMLSREQAPYSLPNLVIDRETLPAYLESRGYLNRTVTIVPAVNDAGTDVQLAVTVREGPQVLVGEIIVVGNEKISAETVLREITLRVGAPYSEGARAESQLNLYNNLTGFRTVQISVDDLLPGETRARVVIAVEEATATTFDIGGGLEAGTRPQEVANGPTEDRFDFAPRAFVGIGRQNLGGRNRGVNAFARVSFKRKTIAEEDEEGTAAIGRFLDYRVTASYRERYAFRSETQVLVSVTAEQAIRTSYNFIRRVASAEFLRPISPRITGFGRYSLEWTKLFDEAISIPDQPLIDRLFPQVRLSLFSAGALWDRRDDPLATTTGEQLDSTVDVALEPLGSEVGFVRFFTQGSIYRPLTSSKRLIFAARAQLGLARGFERTVTLEDENGDPILGPGGEPIEQVVADLPASHRFFSGGGNSVRGFQQDRLGVEEILNPDGLSTGGNGLVAFNAELRATVGKLWARDLAVVAFVDAGNVFNRASELDLARLRSALGFGVRWDSPLGPLRLDFGFKTDRMVFRNGPERRWEFHLSIGEVF